MNPFDPKSALLAKHAQHVVLVHFPIALFLTGVAFDFAARWTRRRGQLWRQRLISTSSPLLLLYYRLLPPASRLGSGNSQDTN